METIAENLPTLNASQAPSKPLTENISQAAQDQKFSQLKALLSQSFEVFNIYGKQPETLKSMILAFNLALEDQNIADINYAFREWLRTQSAMPTPADIRKLAMAEAQHKRKYAKPATHVAAEPLPKTPIVQWAGKKWDQFTDSDKQALAAHMETFDDPAKAKAYRWYLHEFCGAPSPERQV